MVDAGTILKVLAMAQNGEVELPKGLQRKQRNVLVLTDIDGVHCHSTNKFRKLYGDEHKNGEACAFDMHGKALCYRTRKQAKFLEWLNLAGTVIPVTGRTSAKYKELDLGFSSHAICSFGAVILNEAGQPNLEWTSMLSVDAAIATPELRSFNKWLMKFAVDPNIRSQIVVDAGMELYIKVFDVANNASAMHATATMVTKNLPQGWHVHHNENQLCILPSFLSKAAAVKFYLKNIAAPHLLLLGVGDSQSDTEFMSECDFMIAPTASQLFNSLKSE